jgi:hypothetical protein
MPHSRDRAIDPSIAAAASGDAPGRPGMSGVVLARRDAIGTLLAGSSAVALGVAGADAKSRDRRGADPQALAASLPTSDPAFNVRALGRLQGDLSGKTLYSYSQGLVFGLVPGDGPPLAEYGRLIYRTEGVSVRMSRTRPDGSIEDRSRNWLFYRDADSGEYITEFTNPYTGERLSVPTFRGGIGGSVMTVNGPQISANFTMESTVFNRPLQLGWTFVGDTAFAHRHAFTRWKEGATGFQKTEMTLDAWVCRIADVANERLTMIPSSYSWTSQTEWQSWLKMRGRPGAMLWRNDSQKVDRIDALPKAFVERSEKMMPGKLTEPLTWA